MEVIRFESSGDRDPGTPLDALSAKSPGISIFADECERALLNGEIDAAVHSLKDLSIEETPGLQIIAILPREDARDVLVSEDALLLSQLPVGARVGTCSLRRSLQVLALRPDIKILPVRGAVERRIEKMNAGAYEALVLAAAGLNRLGLQSQIAEIFPVEKLCPAPGQGALAVQCRQDDAPMAALLSGLEHRPSRLAVEAERQFLKVCGADYVSPLAAFASSDGIRIFLDAVHFPGNDQAFRKIHLEGTDPRVLAEQAAKNIFR